MSDTNGIERALVVVAHPDDVDFGNAGTIAQWTRSGIEVSYCIITDGAAGGRDKDVSREEMARLRQLEQRAAGECVGVEDITFLGYPDGRLIVTLDLRRDITRVIRQKRPQRVLCQSPERAWNRIYASHPDHLAAAEATLCAVYPDARNPFAHPELLEEEGLEEHVVGETWLTTPNEADRFIDITDTFDLKLAALRCHVTQVGHMDDLEGRIREWGTRVAETAGLGDGRLAEAYRVVDTG